MFDKICDTLHVPLRLSFTNFYDYVTTSAVTRDVTERHQSTRVLEPGYED